MDSLHYATNRKLSKDLRERVPLSFLVLLRREPASTRALALRGDRMRPSAGKAMAVAQWNLFRVRPYKHPARRIAGAAVLVDEFTDAGPAYALESDVQNLAPQKLARRLTVPKVIGAGKAADMVSTYCYPCSAPTRGSGGIGSYTRGARSCTAHSRGWTTTRSPGRWPASS